MTPPPSSYGDAAPAWLLFQCCLFAGTGSGHAVDKSLRLIAASDSTVPLHIHSKRSTFVK